ncbi:hypothetical protein NQ095_04500 [Rossellomorea sp. SC111]|nr:hypothetical protein [Rossellomorea sp. SC111]
MHGAHGIGYEVYKRKHEVRMQVEKKREQDYKQSRLMIAALDRRVHANI